MDKFAGEQTEQSPTQPNIQRKTTLAARLFSVAIVVYLVVCVAGFIFLATVFRLIPVLILSLISALPLIGGLRLRRRWNSVKVSEIGLLVVLLAIATGGEIMVVKQWYKEGDHLAPSEEARIWKEFKQQVHREPGLQNIEIRKLKEYFVSGKVESEADFQRLISLATKCGIAGESYSDYWRKYVSITNRDKDSVDATLNITLPANHD